MQLPPLTGHHYSDPFDIPHIDMCTFKLSETRTLPYSGQLTVVQVVSLLQLEISLYYMLIKIDSEYAPPRFDKYHSLNYQNSQLKFIGYSPGLALKLSANEFPSYFQ